MSHASIKCFDNTVAGTESLSIFEISSSIPPASSSIGQYSASVNFVSMTADVSVSSLSASPSADVSSYVGSLISSSIDVLRTSQPEFSSSPVLLESSVTDHSRSSQQVSSSQIMIESSVIDMSASSAGMKFQFTSSS